MTAFKIISGYKKYTISTNGVVKNIKFEKELKHTIDKDGYFYVGLYSDTGGRKKVKIHRLIALEFIPNPENKKEVNHINGNKQDNILSNLEWTTRKENAEHAGRTNLMNPLKGEKCKTSKLKDHQILDIRKSGISNRQLSKIYGVSDSVIGKIKRRESWSHI